MKNQSLASDSAPRLASASKVPSRNPDSAFEDRFREVLGTESVTAFGRRCGIGEGTLRAYLKGSLPVIDKATAIADTANVSIEWLVTGRGPKQRGAASIPVIPPAPPLPASHINVQDTERLQMAIEAIEEGLGATRYQLSPTKYAQLVVAVYDLLDDMEQKDNVVKFIKLAA